MRKSPDMEIITNGPRKHFHPWEWREIQMHFVDYRNWKYEHEPKWAKVSWSYYWFPSWSAVAWDNVLIHLKEGQWK